MAMKTWIFLVIIFVNLSSLRARDLTLRDLFAKIHDLTQYSFTVEQVGKDFKAIGWGTIIERKVSIETIPTNKEEIISYLKNLKIFSEINESSFGPVLHLVFDPYNLRGNEYPLENVIPELEFIGEVGDLISYLSGRFPTIKTLMALSTSPSVMPYDPIGKLILHFKQVRIRDILSYCLPREGRPILFISKTFFCDGEAEVYFMFLKPKREQKAGFLAAPFELNLGDAANQNPGESRAEATVTKKETPMPPPVPISKPIRDPDIETATNNELEKLQYFFYIIPSIALLGFLFFLCRKLRH